MELPINIKRNYIATEEGAIKVAEAVLFQIYGESINDQKPYTAVYIEEDEAWYICGTPPELVLCGSVEMMIKKDGTILWIYVSA